MSHSSLFDSDNAAGAASGHDIASLGPSDTSDSGSDMAGADGIDSGDSLLPVDVALGRGGWQTSRTSRLGSDSDSSGTGEGGGAGDGGGLPEAGDIRPDRLISVDGSDVDAAMDPALEPEEMLLSEMALDEGDDGPGDELAEREQSEMGDLSAPRDPTLVPKVRAASR